jgi:hypothetical protein
MKYINGHKNLRMNRYLVGDMNLVAMTTNMMWQLFHWPSLIFYESIASSDVQSVVDYEEVTLVEVNPQSKSKTSCKEFKYDLVLNLIHLEKKLKTQIKYCTSNKPIDYISRSTML